ncbi:MAG: hypothetical protein K8F91_09100 [Candidatus Obscuribacterales bacterium]|nr:hypothetical protein [Candidatus Obscuribacterales bacterium]
MNDKTTDVASASRRRRLIVKAAVAFVVVFVIVLLNLKEIVKSSPQFFGYRGDDLFGVYICGLDGKGFQRLISDPKREMTHARLSPDRRRITFTRYNKLLDSGLAEENGSNYVHSEIMVANADGSALRPVVASGPETMNANSSWLDNDRLIFVHSSNLKKSLPELRILNLSSNQSSRVPTPKQWAVADPTCFNDIVVFPSVSLSNDSKACNALWRMRLDGSELQQLTAPKINATSTKLDFKLGDYDPWLSPDGETVTFMRYFGGTDWRIFTIDLRGKFEKQLTESGIPSGIPKWSSDAKAIVYVCWDNSKLENIGLYTFDPTGTSRRKVPLPGGYLYTHPSFFPESGSQSSAKIIFSARRVPGLPGSVVKNTR